MAPLTKKDQVDKLDMISDDLALSSSEDVNGFSHRTVMGNTWHGQEASEPAKWQPCKVTRTGVLSMGRRHDLPAHER